MKRELIGGILWLLIIAACLGATKVGLDRNERRFEAALATMAEIERGRAELAEASCEGRIISILQQVDMECFGTWTTADGDITLYPQERKEAQ